MPVIFPPAPNFRGDQTTPDRATYLELDGSFMAVARPAWFLRRAAEEIKRQEPQITGLLTETITPDVQLIPDGAWILRHLRGESAQIVTLGFSGAVIGAADVETAPNFAALDMFKPLGFTGLGEAAGLASSVPAFRKRVPAGTAWDGAANILAADASAFVSPNAPTDQIIPLDRVLRGHVNYPPNQGYALAFRTSAGWVGTDALIRFFFGGDAPVYPAVEGGGPGTFCVELRGSGQAYLWELNGPADDPANWQFRMHFRWAEPMQVVDALHWVVILPYARDRILFVTRHTGHVVGTNLLVVGANTFSRPPTPHDTLYRENFDLTGYSHTYSMTGAGPIRLEIRRDVRAPVTLCRLKFPVGGTLIDNAFKIPRVPAGTRIQLSLSDTYSQLGGALSVTLHRMDTGAALSGDNVSGFLAEDGESCYFPKFAFTSDSTRYTSPVLFSYAVQIEGLRVARVTVPESGGLLERASGTGPDIDPTHETFGVSVRATYGDLPVLRVRDSVYARVNLLRPSNGLYLCTLFEGQTMKAVGELKMDSELDPPQEYRHYDPLRMVGMWGRLARAISSSLIDWRRDENAPVDPRTGSKPPWKVTSIVRYLLQDAGAADDEIDVPDIDFRLWQSPHLGPKDYMIQPGTSHVDALHTLCIKILGRYLIRDPNAGPVGRGMWRLLTPKQPPYTNILCDFVKGEPLPGRMPNAPGAYGLDFRGFNLVPMTKYRDFAIGPEFNDLIVTGTGSLVPNQQGQYKLMAHWRNYLSCDFLFPTLTADPSSPDWIGYPVPAVVYDQWLNTQAAVDFVTWRLADFAGHGKYMCEFTAPLVLVIDPEDPLQRNMRPLRLNDLIKVGGTRDTVGRTAIVKNVNFGWERDMNQMADYVAIFVE